MKTQIIAYSIIVLIIISLGFYSYKLNNDIELKDNKIVEIEKEKKVLNDLIKKNEEEFISYKNDIKKQLEAIQTQKKEEEKIEDKKEILIKEVNKTNHKSLDDVKLKETINKQINEAFGV